MATLYDEHGTEIYAGRGKYSRNARTKIAERAAYVRNDEGQLVVYVPENENEEAPRTQRASTLDEDARALKRRAQRLGRQLGLGFDELEIRQETEEGVLVAHLRQLQQAALVAGLDSDQAAKLMQTISFWTLRLDINVHEHEELIRNTHNLLNPMRAPVQGAPLLNRPSNMRRDSGVNTVPGKRSREIHDELWIHAFLPPNDHPCRPSVTPANPEVEANEHTLRNDGRVWFEPALLAGPEFVCDNLRHASQLDSFQRGRHGIVRIFLPYNPTGPAYANNNVNHYNEHRDRRCLPEPDFNRENEPWSDCLERFIAACAAVKNSVRPDLRLLIHRGGEQPQEVSL